jgi:hypothetical protein
MHVEPVSNTKGRAQIEGVWEQRAYLNIRILEWGSGRRLEKTEKWGKGKC